MPKAPTKPGKVEHVAKTFSIAPFSTEGHGKRLMLYGKSGIGKSSLAALIDGAVFLAADDGAKGIINPATGKVVDYIPGIASFQDTRDALHQKSLWTEGQTLVFDTITRFQTPWAEQYVIDNIPKEKGGRAKNLNEFGWGDGYRHVYDTMRLPLSDLESHIAAGRNVLFLAQLDQVRVANAGGADYLEDGPKLQHNNKGSVRTEYIEWCDHVFRIGYLDLGLQGPADATVAKAKGEDMSRAVYTGGAAHFIAKSRLINGYRIPAVISFSDETDDSLWQYVLNGAREEGA